jgi:hypothetical protein
MKMKNIKKYIIVVLLFIVGIIIAYVLINHNSIKSIKNTNVAQYYNVPNAPTVHESYDTLIVTKTNIDLLLKLIIIYPPESHELVLVYPGQYSDKIKITANNKAKILNLLKSKSKVKILVLRNCQQFKTYKYLEDLEDIVRVDSVFTN